MNEYVIYSILLLTFVFCTLLLVYIYNQSYRKHLGPPYSMGWLLALQSLVLIAGVTLVAIYGSEPPASWPDWLPALPIVVTIAAVLLAVGLLAVGYLNYNGLKNDGPKISVKELGDAEKA